MTYDAEVSRAVAQWAPYYGVPVDTALVHAVIEKETRHGALPLVALESDGDYSYGPMQVKGATARTVLGVADPSTLEDPATGIWYGTRYLASLVKKFPGDIPRAVAGYNAGPGNAVRSRVTGNFPNQGYVNDVLSYWQRYKTLLLQAAVPALALLAVGVYLVSRRRRKAA